MYYSKIFIGLGASSFGLLLAVLVWEWRMSARSGFFPRKIESQPTSSGLRVALVVLKITSCILKSSLLSSSSVSKSCWASSSALRFSRLMHFSIWPPMDRVLRSKPYAFLTILFCDLLFFNSVACYVTAFREPRFAEISILFRSGMHCLWPISELV